jgi:dUTP pyrophosphatase
MDLEGPGLHLPKRSGDVGYDLEAAKTVTLNPGQQVDIPTNVRVKLPEGVWGEIRARSSIARKGLQVDAGVIDNGYTGPLLVLMRNMNRYERDSPICDWAGRVIIEKGSRIAQLVLHLMVAEVDVSAVEDLDHDPRRGLAAFGSTGV